MNRPDRDDWIAITCCAVLALIVASDTVAGILMRAALVAPLYWTGFIELDTAETFALGWRK